MEIGSVGNLYTLAPGTANSPIRPEAELSFEESNEAVDKTLDKVSDVQDSKQATQDLKRQTTVDLVEIQLQQNNIERYIEASTGEEVESFNSVPSANELIRAQQTNSLSDIPLERDQNSPQDQLQERISNIVNDNGDTQSQLDILA